MATAPGQGLPILYGDVVPLSSIDHATWKVRPFDSMSYIAGNHAFPVTTDEFLMAQRFFPIIFSSGSDPVPLALMGLNEGMNAFVDEAGNLEPNTYLPAYVRRYPFMLARLQPEAPELSLCFDPTPGLLGDDVEGTPLFDGEAPGEQVKSTLSFCEQFEMSAQRTGQFMKDLIATGLLEDGEVTINNPDYPQPFVYRGFQMVNEQKLRDLRGDQLRKLSQSGMLPLLWAHVFSLGLMSEVFERQRRRGMLVTQL